MELVRVRDLYRDTDTYSDKKVAIGGWIRWVRASKNFGFIVLSDGTFFKTLQVVFHDNM